MMSLADWAGAGICVVLMIIAAVGTVRQIRAYRAGEL